MKYEFKGKSLSSVVSQAVAKNNQNLSHKGSDSDSASVRSGGRAKLSINVERNERYTVDWSARPEDDDVYSVDIFTDVGMGSHREAFSDDGSWSFRTGNYEGEVTIIVEFVYAYSALRYLDVSVG